MQPGPSQQASGITHQQPECRLGLMPLTEAFVGSHKFLEGVTLHGGGVAAVIEVNPLPPELNHDQAVAGADGGGFVLEAENDTEALQGRASSVSRMD